MRRLIVLDAGPLGLLSKAPGRPDAARCIAWVRLLIQDGTTVAVPEIARYEVRRELFRMRSSGGLARLDQLHPGLLRLPITADVMDRAAELWADVRRVGLPTAADDSLDGDVILAAQALVAEEDWPEVVIATGNLKHLSRFSGLDSRQWDLIR